MDHCTWLTGWTKSLIDYWSENLIEQTSLKEVLTITKWNPILWSYSEYKGSKYVADAVYFDIIK